METVRQKDESLIKQGSKGTMQLPLDTEGPRGKDYRKHVFVSPVALPSHSSQRTYSLLTSGQASLYHVVELWTAHVGVIIPSGDATLRVNRGSLCNCGCTQGGTHSWLSYFPLPLDVHHASTYIQ